MALGLSGSGVVQEEGGTGAPAFLKRRPREQVPGGGKGHEGGVELVRGGLVGQFALIPHIPCVSPHTHCVDPPYPLCPGTHCAELHFLVGENIPTSTTTSPLPPTSPHIPCVPSGMPYISLLFTQQLTVTPIKLTSKEIFTGQMLSNAWTSCRLISPPSPRPRSSSGKSTPSSGN